MAAVAINGLGRVGRAALKILLDTDGLDLVAVNDVADLDNLAYLLRYDTVYGRYHRDVTAAKGALVVDGKRIPAFTERDPANLPWDDLGVDLVLECTGAFATANGLGKHLEAGASYVILSAPTKSEAIPTVVHGVNRPDGRPQMISCASCTTNCITPVIEIAHRRIGVERAVMTTVHAYTAGQQLVDGPSRSFRRGRAGAANLVPTSTGAAQATTRAMPELAGRFDGIAVRAPIPVGSIADIVFVASRPTTTAEVNDGVPARGHDRSLRRHPRHFRGPAGLRRHRRRPTRGDHRPRADHGRGRHAGQGDGLVRQRMGLYPADDSRGPRHPRRHGPLTMGALYDEAERFDSASAGGGCGRTGVGACERSPRGTRLIVPELSHRQPVRDRPRLGGHHLLRLGDACARSGSAGRRNGGSRACVGAARPAARGVDPRYRARCARGRCRSAGQRGPDGAGDPRLRLS